MLHSQGPLGLLSVSSMLLSCRSMAAGDVFLTQRGPGVCNILTRTIGSLVFGVRSGLVGSRRHHTALLNFTRPLKFLFLGRNLKYCAVLACWWSLIIGACEGTGVSGDPLQIRGEPLLGPGSKIKGSQLSRWLPSLNLQISPSAHQSSLLQGTRVEIVHMRPHYNSYR